MLPRSLSFVPFRQLRPFRCGTTNLNCSGDAVPPLPATVGEGPALPSISTLSVALFPCARPLCRSCSCLLRLCTPSFVSSQATFPSVTLCLGTPSRCMGSVLVSTARFASLGRCPVLLGCTPWCNAAGAASSISSSAARLPRLSARILLICGLIFWISCLVTLSRLRTRARRCTLTLLTLQLSAAVACRGSWILSASCPLVPALFLLLCARFLPGMSFWLERLLLMRPCLLVNACLLLVWCTVACDLFACRPLPVLPGVVNPHSAPSGVLRPKPLWGKAWSPICFFFFARSTRTAPVQAPSPAPDGAPLPPPTTARCLHPCTLWFQCSFLPTRSFVTHGLMRKLTRERI
jgi:hypothetical protein